MTPEPELAVAIARLEAQLEGIKNQIDHSERTSQQFSKLVEERFSARFDSLDRRLSDMDAARERARKDDQHAREQMELRHTALELRVTALEKVDLNVLANEVSELRDFKIRAYTLASVLGLVFGAAGTAIARALGGS